MFIYADDLGWGDLGCYGSDSIKTPNLDYLAREGVRFTDFYATASVCTPSRAGLLTGRYQIRSDMTHIEAMWVDKGLPEEEITMADVLKGEGYRTVLVGKWHLGHKNGHIPKDHGFDEFFGLLFSNDMNIRNNPSYGHKVKDEDLLSLWRDTIRVDQEVYLPTLTQRYTCEAKKFILKNRHQPFFLYMAHWAPHEPFSASVQFKGKSLYGLYGDVVEEMDHSVGEIIETLRNLDLLDKTIIVFSSDNGAIVIPQRFGNHESAGSNGGLRGRKTFTFEGGIRVPTKAYWKGHTQKGKVESQPAIMTDWLPTFANIANASLPENVKLDGVDLSSVLFDDKKLKDRTLYFYRHDELQSVRQGKWKYKVADMPGEKRNGKYFSQDCFNEEPVLFNLEEDPGERNNLVKQYPKIARMLQSKIDSFSASVVQ